MPIKFRALKRSEEAASHFLLGISHLDKEKWNFAEKEFKEALHIWPRYASAWYCLGVVYYNQKKFDAAGAALKAALKVDPRLADAHFLLGKLYFETFSFVKALKHFTLAFALAPTAQLKEYILLCKEALRKK